MSPRVPLKLRVDWGVAGSAVRFVSRTEDMSAGGMLLATVSPVEVGTRLALRIPPVEGGARSWPIDLEGTVVHRGARGMGVAIDRSIRRS